MIKKYKGIKILDKPAGKLRKNDKKETPDELINSNYYYLVKSNKIDFMLYGLYNKYNRCIGSARVYFNEIDNIKNIGNAHIQIVKAYQRKGLATLLYNFIEKDLKIKLKPSYSPSENAKAFWKDRLKQKNPKLNEKLYEKLKLLKCYWSKK